jgi:hypothetical protein
VLAETLQELARQLGEAQERAARAETEAEQLRRQLERQSEASSNGSESGVDQPAALDGPDALDDERTETAAVEAESSEAAASEAAAADHHETLWLAANEHFLRTLPSAAARQEAGDRLLGGRRVDNIRKARRRLRRLS